MTGLALFAQTAKRTEPFLRKEEDWVVVGLLIGAMFLGAFVLWLAERWRKRSTAAPSAVGELTDFRGMYERGEITEEEYARLRTRVAQRVKNEVAPPVAPAPPGAQLNQPELLDPKDQPPPNPANPPPTA